MSNLVVIAETTMGLGVCVPKEWTDEQVLEAANREKPTGGGIKQLSSWSIPDNPKARIPCEQDSNRKHVGLVF